MVQNRTHSTFHPKSSGHSKALVRPPGKSFTHGLASKPHGPVDFDLAREQHSAYCKTLEEFGLEVISLPALEAFPDSCFLEDTVIMTELVTIVARPGHPSRLKETEDVTELLKSQSLIIESIKAPGTLDGGDVLRVDNHFYIGRSQRTNQSGAWQLAEILTRYGFSASEIPVHEVLHLKTGVTWLGGQVFLGLQSMAKHFPLTPTHQWITVDPTEAKSANSLRLQNTIIIPSGCPTTEKSISSLGLGFIAQNISEFEKKDGSLTCLSVVF